jgi:DNA-binding transcriptional MerR regulator
MNGSGNDSSFPWETEQDATALPGEPTAADERDDADANAADMSSINDSPTDAAVDDETSAAQDDEGDVLPPHGDVLAGDDAAGRDETASRRADRQLVRKEYYAISEVADLVGLPAHVLRYWESQFSVLNPSKNRSGNRVYQRKEIRLTLLEKQLLHDETYTLEGAKQKLEQLRRGGTLGDATTHALDTQLVRVMREELRGLLDILTPDSD